MPHRLSCVASWVGGRARAVTYFVGVRAVDGNEIVAVSA